MAAPWPRAVRACVGWTLVELLVALLIVGMLLAVVLPAVHSVRSGARDSVCLNNLRQIGLAMQSHHTVRGKFPPGGVEWRPARNKTRRQLAWSAYLLPYLDREDLYRRLDLGKAFDSPENAAAAAVVLEVYLCPASGRTAPRVEGRGACDYGGIYGERISGPNSPPKGVMIYDRAFARHEITDGLATTLMVSEDCQWHEGQWINGRNVFDQAFGINQAPAFENDIRSHHTGGAHGLFCDGRARFLDQTMDLRVLAAICTRAANDRVEGLGD